MARKINRTKRVSAKVAHKRVVKNESFWGKVFNQIKFGESYTSLLLGVLVVIVAILVIASFVKNKNIVRNGSTETNSEKTQTTETVRSNPNEYVVASGDSLWTISEKVYKDGYKWVDIAKANNLSDPGLIFSGNKLKLPKEEAPKTEIAAASTVDTAAVNTDKTQTQSQVQQIDKITGNTYTVQKDDDLWNIAVRAYADGYKWVDIAKANNLANPDMIFSGNVLTLPR